MSWYASSACPPTISNHLQLRLPTLRCHSDAHCVSSHNHATPVAGLNLDQCLISLDFVPMSREIRDRKSTRLNSSHTVISYAVFCLKKKKNTILKRLRRLCRPSTARTFSYPRAKA